MKKMSSTFVHKLIAVLLVSQNLIISLKKAQDVG